MTPVLYFIWFKNQTFWERDKKNATYSTNPYKINPIHNILYITS
uniref:Uncharacterized protein n=1 Tax=Arundo donax TaxID=35708 RepID=A0A0A9BHM3_ARUDO